jgi:hypothetical protein
MDTVWLQTIRCVRCLLPLLTTIVFVRSMFYAIGVLRTSCWAYRGWMTSKRHLSSVQSAFHIDGWSRCPCLRGVASVLRYRHITHYSGTHRELKGRTSYFFIVHLKPVEQPYKGDFHLGDELTP